MCEGVLKCMRATYRTHEGRSFPKLESDCCLGLNLVCAKPCHADLETVSYPIEIHDCHQYYKQTLLNTAYIELTWIMALLNTSQRLTCNTNWICAARHTRQQEGHLHIDGKHNLAWPWWLVNEWNKWCKQPLTSLNMASVPADRKSIEHLWSERWAWFTDVKRNSKSVRGSAPNCVTSAVRVPS